MKPKRELQDFEVHQQKGFEALERRKAAEATIVLAAIMLEKAREEDMHPLDVDLRLQALMKHVRDYNQAEADFRAAQEALDERARTR